MIRKLSQLYRSSSIYELVNWSDDRAKGRSCLVLSAVLSTIYSNLTAGVFYTGFLLANDIDVVNIGVIAMIPYLTSVFSLFSPLILERIKRRKLILTVTRMLFVLINIGGVTLMPLLNISQSAKYVSFIVLVFVAHTIQMLFNPGYTPWHMNFYPEDIRPRFFSFQQITGGAFYALTLLLSGVITDAVRESGNQLQVMIIIRFVALGIALLEAIVLAIPREYDYPPASEIPTVRSLFRIAKKNKKYLSTISLMGMFGFSSYLTLSAFDVYMLEIVGAGYTFVNGMMALYFVVLLLLTSVWRRFLRHARWLRTFSAGMLIYGTTVLFYPFFTSANYLWLFPILRLFVCSGYVGINLASANIPYINLPEQDRTNCISLYSVMVNLSYFAGQSCGTAFLAATKNFKGGMFCGMEFTNIQMLFLVQAVLVITTGIVTWIRAPKLETQQN